MQMVKHLIFEQLIINTFANVHLNLLILIIRISFYLELVIKTNTHLYMNVYYMCIEMLPVNVHVQCDVCRTKYY